MNTSSSCDERFGTLRRIRANAVLRELFLVKCMRFQISMEAENLRFEHSGIVLLVERQIPVHGQS